MDILSVCLLYAWCPQIFEEIIWNLNYRLLWAAMWCWDLNLVSLKEQPVLLTCWAISPASVTLFLILTVISRLQTNCMFWASYSVNTRSLSIFKGYFFGLLNLCHPQLAIISFQKKLNWEIVCIPDLERQLSDVWCRESSTIWLLLVLVYRVTEQSCLCRLVVQVALLTCLLHERGSITTLRCHLAIWGRNLINCGFFLMHWSSY